MKDSLLLRIALATSIIGLCALGLILEITGLQEVSISEAKDLGEDKTVRITGVVERVTNKDKFAIINIMKEEKITVVLFDNINLSRGQRVEIIGKTKNYKGEKEVIADEIIIK